MPIFHESIAICGLCEWEEHFDLRSAAEKALAEHRPVCPCDCDESGPCGYHRPSNIKEVGK